MANPAAVYAATSRTLANKNQQFFDVGASLGGGMSKGFLGNLEAQHGLGLIDDATYYATKAKAHQAKYANDLWEQHGRFEEWKKGSVMGVNQDWEGPAPMPLKDFQKKMIGLPTSWEEEAYREASAIMDPTADYSEAERQAMFDAMPDLQRQVLGLPVYSIEERKDMLIGDLYGKWLKGTLTEDEALKFKELYGKKDGRTQQALEEVETYVNLGAQWWAYLADNNLDETKMSPKELKERYADALGGMDAAVRFNRLRGKHGDRFEARDDITTGDEFDLAKALFDRKIEKVMEGIMSPSQIMDFRVKVGRAKSWEELAAITGPEGQSWGEYASAGVKNEENMARAKKYTLLIRKLESDAKHAEGRLTDVERAKIDTIIAQWEHGQKIALMWEELEIKKVFEIWKEDRDKAFPTVDRISATSKLNAASSALKALYERGSTMSEFMTEDEVKEFGEFLQEYIRDSLRQTIGDPNRKGK
jgi:hypothetical protein